jgi:serine/threonine protein kinase
MRNGSDKMTPKRSQKEGSPYYFAPEIFGSEILSGIKADIWALGVTLYQM